MKARLASVLAILALSTAVLSPATAQQPQTLSAAETTEHSITAESTAILPALDSPAVTTTAAATLPAEEPATATTQPSEATADPSLTVDPVPAPVASEPLPAVDPYSGNPIVDCEAQGLITAEDHTCVPASFYASATEPQPEATEPTTEVCQEDEPCWDCATMGNKICGASAGQSLDQWLAETCTASTTHPGVVRHCHYLEATYLFPSFKYLGSGTEPHTCATYWTRSTKDEEVIHSYTDGVPSSDPACTIYN